MKNIKLKLAVISALSLLSTQPQAAFQSLPASGGTTAYIDCNTTGNFGSGTSTKPATTSTAECHVPQSGTNPPDPTGEGSGYTTYLGSSKVRSIIVNNTYTGGVAKTIGSLNDTVWRNAGGTSCIYGTKVTMTQTDYNSATGSQYLEVNDIARGGFSGKTVKAAYTYPGSPSEVVFRIGQAYTAVQHRSSGYSSLPLTGLGSSPSINGLDSWPGTASATQQKADWDGNWVDFTTDANARDDDGSTTAASPWVFVKADACPALSGSVPADTAGAIRLRQTFQEQSTDGANPAVDQRFIEISLPGFAPSGSSAGAPDLSGAKY